MQSLLCNLAIVVQAIAVQAIAVQAIAVQARAPRYIAESPPPRPLSLSLNADHLKLQARSKQDARNKLQARSKQDARNKLQARTFAHPCSNVQSKSECTSAQSLPELLARSHPQAVGTASLGRCELAIVVQAIAVQAIAVQAIAVQARAPRYIAESPPPRPKP